VQLVFSCSFALNFRSYDQVATNVVRGAGRRTFGLVLVVIDVVVLIPSLAVPCLSIALRVKLLTCACRQQVLAGWPAARLDFRTAWPGQSHQGQSQTYGLAKEESSESLIVHEGCFV